MNALYRLFRSVKLAVVLIAVIVVLAALATLIPQGREAAFYHEGYPSAVAAVIAVLHFDRLFSSALFLVPMALFAANLGVCSVDRFLTRQRTGARRRHGPDLLHLGLLVLLAGGVVTATQRQEKLFFMGEGDTVELSNGTQLELLAFRTLTYENGAPKDWISTLSVTEPGRPARSVDVEVNRPLSIGRISIYQSSFTIEGVAHLRDDAGGVSALSSGEGVRDGGSVWYFAEVRRSASAGPVGIFQRYDGEELVETATAGAGERLGPWTVADLSARDLTGLNAVRDPGFYPVLAGLLLAGAGLALTFFQKRGELRP